MFILKILPNWTIVVITLEWIEHRNHSRILSFIRLRKKDHNFAEYVSK